MKKPTREELLKEAAALEAAGGEWQASHVAALWGVSVSDVYRSQCPRVQKIGARAVKGTKPRLRFKPVDVRAFDAQRTRAA